MPYIYLDAERSAIALKSQFMRRARALREIARVYHCDPDAFSGAMASIGVDHADWARKLPRPRKHAAYTEEDLIFLLVDFEEAKSRRKGELKKEMERKKKSANKSSNLKKLTLQEFAEAQHEEGRMWGDQYHRQKFRSPRAIIYAYRNARSRYWAEKAFQRATDEVLVPQR